VARESKALERAADELYGLPLDEFTRARDARAKELRKEGERDAADAVKALRKPTVAAWALNRLARERGEEVERVLDAGAQLRAAQQELLGGGERSAFQRAAAAERELVAKLAAEAVSLAREGGERPGPGFREKLAETLHAAALDEETSEQLRAGRLVREREAIGGFGTAATAQPAAAERNPPAAAAARPRRRAKPDAAAAPPARSARAKPGAAPTARSGNAKSAAAPPARSPRAKGGSAPAKRAARTKPRGERAAAQAARAERDAASADSRRRERLAAARIDERHSRRELDAAAKVRASAEARAEAAGVHAREAAERARTTAERLAEAKRAESAARKAHTRAARALERAERGPGRKS
jgi:hypothetical protein